MSDLRDEFLSEEDLDLKSLSWDELVAYWNLWLLQAQATNDLDADLYSHGVFERDPAPTLGSRRGPEVPGRASEAEPARRPWSQGERRKGSGRDACGPEGGAGGYRSTQ